MGEGEEKGEGEGEGEEKGDRDGEGEGEGEIVGEEDEVDVDGRKDARVSAYERSNYMDLERQFEAFSLNNDV